MSNDINHFKSKLSELQIHLHHKQPIKLSLLKDIICALSGVLLIICKNLPDSKNESE